MMLEVCERVQNIVSVQYAGMNGANMIKDALDLILSYRMALNTRKNRDQLVESERV